MSWKTNLQLLDLDGAQALEVTCRECGYSRYEAAAALLEHDELKFAYLNEVEAALSCTQRGCHGAVRIALSADAETEGFMGGLA